MPAVPFASNARPCPAAGVPRLPRVLAPAPPPACPICLGCSPLPRRRAPFALGARPCPAAGVPRLPWVRAPAPPPHSSVEVLLADPTGAIARHRRGALALTGLRESHGCVSSVAVLRFFFLPRRVCLPVCDTIIAMLGSRRYENGLDVVADCCPSFRPSTIAHGRKSFACVRTVGLSTPRRPCWPPPARRSGFHGLTTHLMILTPDRAAAAALLRKAAAGDYVVTTNTEQDVLESCVVVVVRPISADHIRRTVVGSVIRVGVGVRPRACRRRPAALSISTSSRRQPP